MPRNAALAVAAFVGVLYGLSLLVALAVRLLGGAPAAPAEGPTLLLVSVDGFRHDYLGRYPAPTLERIASEGVRAERLIPAYPSVTFPNHTTLVTGLRPVRHGITGNRFADPALGVFEAGDPAAQRDARWWLGEPIWATAERQGLRAMVLSWPGVEAPHRGVLPTRGSPFDGGLDYGARVDTVLAWLALPPSRRPQFLTLYFDGVDNAGHGFGPDAPETRRAVAEVDRALGRLLACLEDRAEDLDIVVVSDHGMTEMAADRVVVLDEFLGSAGVEALQDDLERAMWDEPAMLWPKPGREAAVLERLRQADLPHVRVVRRDDAPEALHVRGSRRVAPVLLVADEGWAVATRAETGRPWLRKAVWGTHGFDPWTPSMGGLFLARGPSFREGVMVGPIENIHVYPLMAHVLGLDPAPHDGDLDAVRSMLLGSRSTGGS